MSNETTHKATQLIDTTSGQVIPHWYEYRGYAIESPDSTHGDWAVHEEYMGDWFDSVFSPDTWLFTLRTLHHAKAMIDLHIDCKANPVN